MLLRLRIAISSVTGRAGLFMSIFLLTSFSFFWIISFYPVLSVCLRQYLQPAGYLLACALWVVTSSGSSIKRSKGRPIPRARPFIFLRSSPLTVTPSLHPTDTDLNSIVRTVGCQVVPFCPAASSSPVRARSSQLTFTLPSKVQQIPSVTRTNNSLPSKNLKIHIRHSLLSQFTSSPSLVSSRP